MKKQSLKSILFLTILTLISCKRIDRCERDFNTDPIDTVQKICFGSCGREWKEEPILNTIANEKPDIFIYVGDNVYIDSEKKRDFERKYYKLCSQTSFQNLIQSCRVLATWDDHDYGKNDGGKEYPQKEMTKDFFMKFWGEENNAERKSHTGIYTSYYFGSDSQRVQIILLDCRTFRDLLATDGGGYVAQNNPALTMLGDEQWTWLAQELRKPAKIRIIGSSIQFARSHNGYEAWANFPLEQEKMFQTIRNMGAKGLFFISGDVHLAELSKVHPTGLYPIYDFTSSGLTETEGIDIGNSNRIGNSIYDSPNYGMITINWNNPITLKFQVGTLSGSKFINYTLPLSDLQ